MPVPHESLLLMPEPQVAPIPPQVVQESPLPIQVIPSPRAPAPRAPSFPGDLGYAEAEQEREERFNDLERQLILASQEAADAEAGRDQTFEDHETQRQHIFDDKERERDEAANQRLVDFSRAMEERLAALPAPTEPIPIPPPAEPIQPAMPIEQIEHVEPDEPAEEYEPTEVGEPTEPSEPSVHVEHIPVPSGRAPSSDADVKSLLDTISGAAQDAASRHAQEVREILNMERDEQAREREQLVREREQSDREREAHHAEIVKMYEERLAQQERDCEEKMRLRDEQLEAIQAQLAAAREEMEKERDAMVNERDEMTREREMRSTEDAERRERERAEDLQRTEDLHTQLAELTDKINQQQAEFDAEKGIQEQRYQERMARCDVKEAKLDEMLRLTAQIASTQAEDRVRLQQEKEEAAALPSKDCHHWSRIWFTDFAIQVMSPSLRSLGQRSDASQRLYTTCQMVSTPTVCTRVAICSRI